MAFKLNIKPELDREVESLLRQSGLRSKTEYINCAVAAFNDKLRRDLSVKGLKSYFDRYRKQALDVMDDFGRVRRHDS